jgi:hypothetical protein
VSAAGRPQGAAREQDPGANLKSKPSIPRGTDDWTRDFDFPLGWRVGFARGYRQSELDTAADWHEMWRKTRTLLDRPTQAELRRRREPVNEPTPCRRRNCGGRCARCIHTYAWRKRGGRPYLGVRGEAELAGAR